MTKVNLIKTIRTWAAAVAFVSVVGGFSGAVLAPTTSFAVDAAGSTCSQGFLNFPAWYKGLIKDASCNILSPTEAGGLDHFIWRIVLNIVEFGLVLVGWVSTGYIIYGGFLLMVSRGVPAYIAEGQTMIRNAIIGLVISFGAVAIVNFAAQFIINVGVK